MVKKWEAEVNFLKLIIFCFLMEFVMVIKSMEIP